MVKQENINGVHYCKWSKITFEVQKKQEWHQTCQNIQLQKCQNVCYEKCARYY